MPILYPHPPQFRDLPADDAAALIGFYDSLHVLEKIVFDWWEREGQLSVNIFNGILNAAGNSLSLAAICIQRFNLDTLYLISFNQPRLQAALGNYGNMATRKQVREWIGG